MAVGAFSVSMEWNDAHVTLDCAGELDLATIHNFRDATTLCLSKRPATMLVDLRPLTFLGSEGIRALIEIAATCRDRTVALDVRVGERTAHVLEVAGVNGLIPYTRAVATPPR